VTDHLVRIVQYINDPDHKQSYRSHWQQPLVFPNYAIFSVIVAMLTCQSACGCVSKHAGVLKYLLVGDKYVTSDLAWFYIHVKIVATVFNLHNIIASYGEALG